MQRIAVLTALLVIGLCGTSTAKAHMLPPPKPNASVNVKFNYWQRNQHHAETGFRWVKQHPQFFTFKKWTLELRDHRWLLKYSQEKLTWMCGNSSWILDVKGWYCYNHVAPPHEGAWLCIHHYEGSWRDSGDPYWGGLQMDRGFMSSYAPNWLLKKGYAHNWSPLEQMWVAERAYRSGRGFYPWPNTARDCGLL